jgi:hypothetical protein
VCRVARWYFFKPKIQIWGNLGGLAIKDVGIFYVHLVILRPFAIFY